MDERGEETDWLDETRLTGDSTALRKQHNTNTVQICMPRDTNKKRIQIKRQKTQLKMLTV